jgi:uncharacterized membrane protein YqjE
MSKVPMMPYPDSAEPLATGDLLKRILEEARELVRLEVGVAKAELREQLARAKQAAIVGALALVCLLLCLCALVVAVVLALGNTVAAALGVALALALGAGILAWIAFALVPKSLLERTREHAVSDAAQLKEHAS